ncbi:ABC transporter permease [Nonomuraea fuscirosea]|uniref:ABC transporter permease n=1 Tax=Nonomuraea fuscirosea TaxID=1291556 RepID=UPI002DDC6A09|nr:ABC transporter permease [Nonomuraea fuscirosea]WSA55905.1 ABC transporter permease [Nonomuraea fuscirosea]
MTPAKAMGAAANARTTAARAGLQRGWIEFRQTMTSGQDLWSVMFFPVVTLVVMFLLRHNTVPGTGFSLGSQALPGILGMNVVLNGMMMLALSLTMDREDGTLLRAKATPKGMTGYLVGKVTSRAATAVIGLLVPLVPAAFLFGGLDLGRASAWVTLVWVVALGLVAVLPFGAILGSLFGSAQGVGFVTFPMMVLMGISGVFYPISGFPEWLQWVGQAFPLYWLALGLRSAMLPEAMAVAEIGESWRHLETAAMLGLWAVAGFLLAPLVLRRMARRQSGSVVEEQRRKAMQQRTT